MTLGENLNFSLEVKMYANIFVYKPKHMFSRPPLHLGQMYHMSHKLRKTSKTCSWVNSIGPPTGVCSIVCTVANLESSKTCQHLRESRSYNGEGNGTPLQYSCLENPMDGGAWWAAVHGVARCRTQLSDFTFTFHFHALEKEMATHSSVLAWRRGA